MEKVSRYLCYPSITHFVPEIGARHYDSWLSNVSPGAGIGIYIHVPFCEHICWFCSCRTQAVRTSRQVSAYVESLVREIRRVGAHLPSDVEVRKVHFAGGSPMVLSTGDIARLGRELRANLVFAREVDFAVEVDALRVDPHAIDTFVSQGMNRATLFVQDFHPDVQLAIGRIQREEDTVGLVNQLRSAGVDSIGIDMLYGLPRQATETVTDTAETVVAMAPERVALHGYAHVPWMAKRQSMIREQDLPCSEMRVQQYAAAADVLRRSEYEHVGVDHFARAGDRLARLARTGRLRRRHLAYTDDRIEAVIGIGASAISSFRQGRIQNEHCTKTYRSQVDSGACGAQKGSVLSLEDRVRGRAIEMLMCGFTVDMGELRREFGDFCEIVLPGLREAAERFGERVAQDVNGLRIPQQGPLLARRVARCLDPLHDDAHRYSYAI